MKMEREGKGSMMQIADLKFYGSQAGFATADQPEDFNG